MTALRRFALAAGALALSLAPVAVDAAPPRSSESSNAVPEAQCGPGSLPETGLQGQVPRADRDSGRSKQGYRCNLSLVGQYQGTGATWVQPSYRHCSYLGSFFPTTLQAKSPGVQVVDASDQRHPRLSTVLGSSAMVSGTWETLKVHPGRGILAAAGTPVPPGVGGLTLDLYDVKSDCAKPRLLNGLLGPLTVPQPVLSHESAFSPDGMTYYLMTATGQLTAIDIKDPSKPRVVYVGTVNSSSHGASFSPDGRTMYAVSAIPSGMQVLDVSEIQDRAPAPQVRQISQLNWSDGLISQHTILFSVGGSAARTPPGRYVYVVDEAGGGGVRLVDVNDPAQPRVLRQYRLEINQPSNSKVAGADTGGDGAFGYDAHYCTIDRPTDPTMLACGFFQSGVRLFDITDPMQPRELAYYNPPAQTGKERQLVNSAHAGAVYLPNVLDPNTFGVQTIVDSLQPSMNTDWCSSPPEFRPGNRLWVTCQDNGFQILEYTPYRKPAPPADDPSPTPSPTASATSSAAPAPAPEMGGLPTSVPAGEVGAAQQPWPWLALAGVALLALLATARRVLR